jgi:hypothetical protein
MISSHGLGTEVPHAFSPPIRLSGKQHKKNTENMKPSQNSLNVRGLGRVVLAPPCADWLDGVEAVTGHDDGEVIRVQLLDVYMNIHKYLKHLIYTYILKTPYIYSIHI